MDSSQRIAVLESVVDHLKTEISYLNSILIQCGFSKGISTLKETALQYLKECV